MWLVDVVRFVNVFTSGFDSQAIISEKDSLIGADFVSANTLPPLVLATKQQTRLDGPFHILPSLLRFSCLQTHVMARTHHPVHRTGWKEVLGLVIHGRQCELRRRRCWVDHVIQFFHHFFHSSSRVFHHLAYHRITVLGRHHRVILFLLLLLPRRVYAFGRFSLPIRITRGRDLAILGGHPAKVFFTLYYLRLFIPWNLLSHWSPFHTHIRSSRVPIGQLFLSM